jgi:hypothetical protein
MNIQEYILFLKESPDYYKSSDVVLSDDYIDNEYGHLSSTIIEQIKTDDFIYQRTKSNTWFIFNGSNPIAMIKITEKDTYCSIIMSITKKKFRGKGIMKKFYEFLIKKYGGILSDTALSKDRKGGSYYLYNSLINKYPTYELIGKKIYKINQMPSSDKSSRVFVSYKERKDNEL